MNNVISQLFSSSFFSSSFRGERHGSCRLGTSAEVNSGNPTRASPPGRQELAVPGTLRACGSGIEALENLATAAVTVTVARFPGF